MAVFELGHMTWDEVRGLDKSRTVAVLPTGAIEAHGPHLPLATDVIIADAMARAGAAKLAARGYQMVLLPPLAYTPAEFAAAFPGTISIGDDAVTAVLCAIAASLAKHDIGVLAVANAHLDPAHRSAIRNAISTTASDPPPTIVFPDLTKKPWASRLTDEFKSGACHAGQYESSIMLAVTPALVREQIRRRLPPNAVSLSQAIQDGSRSFEEAGGPNAYFGYPAAASVAEGMRTVETLGTILEEAVLAALPFVDAPSGGR